MSEGETYELFDKLIDSALVEEAALGVPNRVLATVASDRLLEEDGTRCYLVRVRSEQDPTVSLFLFDGDEQDVAARIRKAARRHH